MSRSECILWAAMNGLIEHRMNFWVTAAALSATLLWLDACGKKPDSTPPESVTAAVAAEVKALTEKGYDFKHTGNNRDALAAFEQAADKLEHADAVRTEEFASNLDDRATIHLRVGNTAEAETLYLRAVEILEELDKKDTRIYAGVQRRLRTLAALKEMGVECDEPMVPEAATADSADTGADNLPYFPDVEALQQAFGKFNLEIKGCLEDSASALPVWTAVTGDGRIALASVKSETVSKKTRECIERQLVESSLRHRDLMPRFSACFRNFTYPLAFRK